MARVQVEAAELTQVGTLELTQVETQVGTLELTRVVILERILVATRELTQVATQASQEALILVQVVRRRSEAGNGHSPRW